MWWTVGRAAQEGKPDDKCLSTECSNPLLKAQAPNVYAYAVMVAHWNWVRSLLWCTLVRKELSSRPSVEVVMQSPSLVKGTIGDSLARLKPSPTFIDSVNELICAFQVYRLDRLVLRALDPCLSRNRIADVLPAIVSNNDDADVRKYSIV